MIKRKMDKIFTWTYHGPVESISGKAMSYKDAHDLIRAEVVKQEIF